jgi:protein TonB
MPAIDEYIPLDNPIKKEKAVCPRYPPTARKLEQQGIVYVKMLVDLNGSVMDVKVIKSSGYPLLDSEAVVTAYKTLFIPNTIMGKPIRFWVAMPVRFEIE